MALTQQSVVDQIEVTRDGTLQVRMCLEVLNGATIISSANHRTSIPPGGDIVGQMQAVNNHLVQMGQLAVNTTDIAKITTVASAVWTTAVVAAYVAAHP